MPSEPPIQQWPLIIDCQVPAQLQNMEGQPHFQSAFPVPNWFLWSRCCFSPPSLGEQCETKHVKPNMWFTSSSHALCIRGRDVHILPKQFIVRVLNAFLVCPPWLGCCVRLAGLVFLLSPVLSPSLSPIWSGMLCPPVWVCFFFLSLALVWDAVSAFLSCLRAQLVSQPSSSPISSSSWSGMPCPPSGLVSKICTICATVWSLRWGNLQKTPKEDRRRISLKNVPPKNTRRNAKRCGLFESSAEGIQHLENPERASCRGP